MAELKAQSKYRFNQENEAANIAEWRSFLNQFQELEQGEAKDRKEKLIALKEAAKVNKVLNYRQVDGIVCRVDNVLSGVYGNTKTSANLNFGKAA